MSTKDLSPKEQYEAKVQQVRWINLKPLNRQIEEIYEAENMMEKLDLHIPNTVNVLLDALEETGWEPHLLAEYYLPNTELYLEVAQMMIQIGGILGDPLTPLVKYQRLMNLLDFPDSWTLNAGTILDLKCQITELVMGVILEKGLVDFPSE